MKPVFIFSPFLQGGITHNVVPNKFVVGKQQFYFLPALSCTYAAARFFTSLVYAVLFLLVK